MIKEVLNKMGIIRKGKASAGVEKAPVATPKQAKVQNKACLLYTSPSPRDRTRSRMPSSA